jgi:adenine phosphoribosyltransferase
MLTIEAIASIIKPRIDCYTNFKEGVNFMDIQSILGDPELNRMTLKGLCLLLPQSREISSEYEFDAVVCFDARGFFYGNFIASLAEVPCILARKPSKLPGDLLTKEYVKEYGTDTIGIQSKRITPGMRILVHDDLLATGGTSAAAAEIILELGGIIIGFNYLMEIDALSGRKVLEKYVPDAAIRSLIHF